MDKKPVFEKNTERLYCERALRLIYNSCSTRNTDNYSVEVYNAIRKIVSALPEKQSKALNMCLCNGEVTEEICQKSGMTKRQYRYNIARALRTLRHPSSYNTIKQLLVHS